MDTVKIIATAIVGTLLALVLKEQKPYMGIVLSFICALCVFFMALPYIEKIITYVRAIYESTGGKDSYINILLKIAGVGTLSSLGSSLCADAGLTSVSYVVAISGKVICMCMVLPVVIEFFTELISILP